MVFSKKWLRNHPQFLLHFLIHIDVLMLCRKFEPIPSSIIFFMASVLFLLIDQLSVLQRKYLMLKLWKKPLDRLKASLEEERKTV